MLTMLTSLKKIIFNGAIDFGNNECCNSVLYSAMLHLQMFGRRLDHDVAKEVAHIDADIMETITPLGNGAELDMFPWLRHLPNKNFKKLTNITHCVTTLLEKEISRNKVG